MGYSFYYVDFPYFFLIFKYIENWLIEKKDPLEKIFSSSNVKHVFNGELIDDNG